MVRALLLVWACFGLFSCQTDDSRSGTYVGNPGKKAVRLAPTDGVIIDFAMAESLTVSAIGCEGGAVAIASEQELELLEDEVLEVPFGTWCAFVVSFEEPLLIAGTVKKGEEPVDFESEVSLPAPLTLWTDGALLVDEDAFVLELGSPGWIGDDEIFELDRESGDDLLESLLASRLAGGTASYRDDNGDGELQEPERNAGPVASAEFFSAQEQTEDDTDADEGISLEGCQCGGVPQPGSALPWLVAGLVIGFRRSRSRGRRWPPGSPQAA